MNTVTSGDQIELLPRFKIRKRTLDKIKIIGKPCILGIFASLLYGCRINVQTDEL